MCKSAARGSHHGSLVSRVTRGQKVVWLIGPSIPGAVAVSVVSKALQTAFARKVKVLKYQLRCKRGGIWQLSQTGCEANWASPGTAEKLIKASAVSNGMIEAGNSRLGLLQPAYCWQEKHLKQWKSLINRRCLRGYKGRPTSKSSRQSRESRHPGCKIDPELILDNMQERAQQICRSPAWDRCILEPIPEVDCLISLGFLQEQGHQVR